ncbi:hypothetical protein NX059_001412 [Plenodomus lindquistii]|nr:hypothetical protein NX059_001412 [Plenodomus lindquistii]
MRTSLLLASALAVGTLARPQPRRRALVIVTNTEIVTTTVVVYVTEEYVEPSSTPTYASTTALLQSTSAATSITSSASPSPSPILSTAATSSSIASLTTESLVASTSSKNIVPSLQSSEPSSKPQPQPQPEPEPSYTAVEQIRSSVAPSSVTPSSIAPEPKPTTAPSLDNHVPGPEQAYLSAGNKYQAAMLYHHNAARANHDAEALTWDAECEANARLAAKKCLFEHYIPEGVDQGQNLFTVSGDAFNATAGVTTSWYQGELAAMMPWFGKPDVPDEVFHSVGHLTQLVWKRTTKFGCVSLDCGDTMIVSGSVSSMNKYTVCNYAPAGNMGGEYAENVAAPISSTNLGGWAN